MSVRPFSSVGACSNRFLVPMLGHGKSPCFSWHGLTGSAGVDHVGYNVTCLDIVVFWECA